MIINKHWDEVLSDIINTESFAKTIEKVNEEYRTKEIYPPRESVFKVFELVNIEDIKIVILGQDPYHTKGMANGIAFSVYNDFPKMPPSLRNIFKELESDLGVKNINKDLTPWVSQGIFMLNTTLTVEQGNANSHKDIGWNELVVETIKRISQMNEKVAFMLWGNFAQGFEKYIDTEKHIVIKTAHPSPLSASRGFLGSKQFSEVQELLGVKFDWRT